MRNPELSSARKLLILGLGDILCERIFKTSSNRAFGRRADAVIGNFFVYKRAHCDEFLRFCFKHFVVGVWSASARHNEEPTVNYLFGKLKNKLAFQWHQDYCTRLTELINPEKDEKPVFLKELSKLWETETPDLLEGANFGASNTVLIEDAPYRAIRNPPHTALFLPKYTANDVDDTFLKYQLQPYLKRLAEAPSVQIFIKENPFGQSPLNSSSPHWNQFKHLIPYMHHDILRLDDPKVKEQETTAADDELSGIFGAITLNKFPKSERKSEYSNKAVASSSKRNGREDKSSANT